MFNLLPEKDKNVVRSEYKNRRLLTGLILLMVALLLGIVTFIPPHVVALFRLQDLTRTKQYLEQSVPSKNTDDLKKNIAFANAKIKALSATDTLDLPTVLADIANARQEAISINKFQIQTVNGKPSVSIFGIAKNRDELLRFAETLRNNPAYAKVDLPVSNFAKEMDIDFTIQITGS